jgi:hypothetical protein
MRLSRSTLLVPPCALDGDQLACSVGLVEERARHLPPEHDGEADGRERKRRADGLCGPMDAA